VTNETQSSPAPSGGTSFGLIVFFVMAFPVYWMISTAFKTNGQIYDFTPSWLPTHLTLAHFRAAINRPYFGRT